MSGDIETPERRRPHVRWLILAAAVTFAVLACAAAVVAFVLKVERPILAGALVIAAISVEVLIWTAAGVFGWGFLAKRRETLNRWRQRLFGAKQGGAE